MLSYTDRLPSFKDRFLDAFYQRDVYRVRCDINRTVLTTPCIGLDRENEFCKHLKTVSGVPIVPKQDDFYVKVRATKMSARAGMIERIARFLRFFCFWIPSAVPFHKPDLSLLPSNLFVGGKENLTTRFYADSRLVEMTLMQKQCPYPYSDWKAPFEEVFTSLQKQRKPYYQPGYEHILYANDKDRPEGLLHIQGFVLSEEARVWNLLASKWETCNEEICEEFEDFIDKSFNPRHLGRGIQCDQFYMHFAACGIFETLKILVDKGFIQIIANPVKVKKSLTYEVVSHSSHFHSPRYYKVGLTDPLKKFDRESLKFNLKDGVLTITGRLVPSV